jgi:hypothetical protein
MNECCQKEENLIVKDGFKVCKICGCRHFILDAEPGDLTGEGKPL